MDIRLTGVRMAFGDGKAVEHILEVTDGVRSWTVEQIVELLASGHKFFVQNSRGDNAYVEVQGGKYIRTRPDGVISDNLLALPGGPLYRPGIISAAMKN